MKRSTLRLAALIAAAVPFSPACAADVLPLMPMPRSVTVIGGNLTIDGPMVSVVTGCARVSVDGAVARFERDLPALVGTELSGPHTRLSIHCRAQDKHLLSSDAKEGYRLAVSDDGVQIEADGETGVLRALATLRQLVTTAGNAPVLPIVRIDDAPRFRWRGVMIDVARHFMTLETLKRQIDAMEQAKLNVLHLHLSDNEAFRVESRKFPKLTSVARDPRYYTQAEIRDLVRYAGERGVRVVPEIDMPGHNLAVVTAYPELAAGPIAANDPVRIAKGALDPSSERTYAFLKDLLAEITPLFPDREFHIGGDEVSNAAWQDNAAVAAFKAKNGLKTKQDVEAHFHSRIRKLLSKLGKTTVGWDEILDTAPPNEVTIQTWRSSNPVSTATTKGHKVIVSAGYYFDHLMPADYIYGIDPLDPVAYTTMTQQVLDQVKRNPVTAALVSDGLVAKPLPPLTAEQEKLVLGGEAPLWSEIVSDEMLDGRLWPRGLTLAERLWSPKELRDPVSMYARLLPTMDRLRSLGLLDNSRRDRMMARLAPESPRTIRGLVDWVAPTRMFSHMHGMATAPGQKLQNLVEPADAASTDGSPARRFKVAVDRFLSGNAAQVAELRADLAGWVSNEAPFVNAAAGRPMLEAAIPAARDLSALGVLGLAALDTIEKGKPLSPEQLTYGRALLKKLADFDNASRSLMAVSMMKQPPAHLIILVTPDVARLVDAAEMSAHK